MIVSGGELIAWVDSITNVSKATTRWLMPALENFDVRTDWREISGAENNESGWNIGLEVLGINETRGIRIYRRPNAGWYTEQMVSGGTVIANVSSPPIAATSGSFRITRTGQDWDSYYLSGGSAWVSLGGPYTVQIFEPANVRIYVSNNTDTPDVSGAFDNFSLVSGGFICPGSSSSSSSSSSVS